MPSYDKVSLVPSGEDEEVDTNSEFDSSASQLGPIKKEASLTGNENDLESRETTLSVVESFEQTNVWHSRCTSPILNRWNQLQTTRIYQRMIELLGTNALPDKTLHVGHVQLIEHVAIVKLFKFIFLTLLFIYLTHGLVRIKALDWEHDENYFITQFFIYDLHSVLLDIITFFVIGRLHTDATPGVDQLAYIIPMMFGIIFPSWSATFGFLQHSLSMYEIMCRWTYATFQYVVVVCCFSAFLTFMHVKYYYKSGILVSKFIEVVLSIGLFMLAMAPSPSFHLHHWYGAWLIGMHTHLPQWWSRATQAYFVGMYINGIAVWGRDPILGCDYSYFTSTSNFCYFMSCYKSDDDNNSTDYLPSIEPNWHNCSAPF